MTPLSAWEQAAKAAGYQIAEEPERPACRTCHPDGRLRPQTLAWLREHGCPECDDGRSSADLVCPRSGDRWAPGEMVWVVDPGWGAVVAAASVVGCECCGERPRLDGEEVCGDCLPRTRRSGELSAAGVGL